MTAMPADISFGFIVGRFLLAVSDGPDANRLPDAVAASGSIDLIPKVTARRSVLTPAATIFSRTFTVTIDTSGFITDARNAQGIWVPVGIYGVSYRLNNVALRSHDINVQPHHTEESPLDLTLEAPLIPEPTTTFVVTEQALLDSQAAAQQARTYAELALVYSIAL